MSSAQQVWEFGRAFLGDWDGQVVVLKVYMDETGTHEGSPIVAASAYIARPKEWRTWTKLWNVAKRPIAVFHSTDCANFQGEFKGWDRERRDSFVASLLPVIRDREMAGIVIGIHLDDFNEALKVCPEMKEMLGSPYAACFQWVVTTVLELLTQNGRKEGMAFVHEINDFRKDCLDAFDYVKKNLNPLGTSITLSFGSKEDYPPLQAADVLAYGVENS